MNGMDRFGNAFSQRNGVPVGAFRFTGMRVGMLLFIKAIYISKGDART